MVAEDVRSKSSRSQRWRYYGAFEGGWWLQCACLEFWNPLWTVEQTCRSYGAWKGRVCVGSYGHGAPTELFKIFRGRKAAWGCRTPQPCGNSCATKSATASWSAAVLCRFSYGAMLHWISAPRRNS